MIGRTVGSRAPGWVGAIWRPNYSIRYRTGVTVTPTAARSAAAPHRPTAEAPERAAMEAGALVLLNFARSTSPLPSSAQETATGEDDERDPSSSAHWTLRRGRKVMSKVDDSVTLSPHSASCHEEHGLLHEYMGLKLHMSVQSQTGYAGVDRKVESGRVWFRAQAPRRLRHIRSHLGRFSSPELAAYAYATFLESPSTYTISDDPRRRKPAKSIPPTPGGKVHKPRRKLQNARTSASHSSASSAAFSSSPSSSLQPV
jgi:hypothetical protein